MEVLDVFQKFYFPEQSVHIQTLGNGLINHTYLAAIPDKQYVIQRLNTSVFKNPDAIASNISSVADYLTTTNPGYNFIRPVNSVKGSQMIRADDGAYWRVFPFINNSYTIDVVQTDVQAYEAAFQFGKLTKMLAGFNLDQLQIVIPHFHDLSFRFTQFEEALLNGNKHRIQFADSLIRELQWRASLCDVYQMRITDGLWKQRVMHHDAKISNVLFNESGKAIAVIDLDTIMPGYFFSDVGDMMRTYLSPVSEEENDTGKITVRTDFFQAIVKGYLSALEFELTNQEKMDFVLAGKIMIYMQSLRFITDFLNNDQYYGAQYELHNFNRALNQLVLLQKVESLEGGLEDWLSVLF